MMLKGAEELNMWMCCITIFILGLIVGFELK